MICDTFDEPEMIRMMRDSIRRFASATLSAESMRVMDKANIYDPAVFAKLGEMGVCGLTVEEKYGGLGCDIPAAIAVIEELSRFAGPMAGPYIHCAFYGGINISEKGTPEQKKMLLPKLAAGEVMFAYGLSEPDIGADLANVKTTADLSKDGDVVIINGSKRWCTMAQQADYIYCLVRSDRDAPKYQNLSFVLIPKGTPGVTIEEIPHAGLYYAPTYDVTFEEVRVPATNIVGGMDAWNRGWPLLAGPALDVEKLEVAALAYGTALACVDIAWQYAKERKQFGKPIAQHQAVGHALAEAQTNLLACRQVLYYAADLAQQGKPCSAETSMAKLFVTEQCEKIGMECQKVLGAYGFADEYDLERYIPMLHLMTVIGGSSAIQRNNISKRLGLV
ncbi:acyl-CoA dehydrogenase family protein [Emcibacter nanhaiensis]|uniref:Acyl-CoA dehydrogenase n=1 Tax=Emcibacter nanhaiensis TaxID=1505037 RepID=A0A501P9R9_9PROT|nr:acyl-CoA dehydrogenase family protein [Emcibacter nanhaiensis]TPD56861.1 acyl-CoA dehydrogenase [Emcibacter nanhaiensis]